MQHEGFYGTGFPGWIHSIWATTHCVKFQQHTKTVREVELHGNELHTVIVVL